MDGEREDPRGWDAGGYLVLIGILAGLILLLATRPARGDGPPQAPTPPQAPPIPAGVRWAKSYAEARAASDMEGRLLVTQVCRDNCLDCEKMHRVTFKDPEVVRLLSMTSPVVVTDGDPRKADVVAAAGIELFPTTVISEPGTGRVLARLVGYQAPEAFVSGLAPHLKRKDAGVGVAPRPFRPRGSSTTTGTSAPPAATSSSSWPALTPTAPTFTFAGPAGLPGTTFGSWPCPTRGG